MIRNQQNKELAAQIAHTILRGFDKHFALFHRITAKAQGFFEATDWKSVQQASRERIYYYDQRVKETIADLRLEFGIRELNEPLWQRIKFDYAQQLLEHNQPELAESYYNSVFCRLFHRRYYNNDNIFVRSSVSTEYLDSEILAYRVYYTSKQGLRSIITSILTSFDLKLPFEDLHRDIRNIVHELRLNISGKIRKKTELNFQFKVLNPLFFRNKAAYIIGKVINGYDQLPFIIPILNNGKGAVYVDTLLLDKRHQRAIFSFSRAYFMVDTAAPAAVVDFLRKILPTKTKAELYSAIGFHKHGKTTFYRDFLYHLKYSADELIIAPGIKGMVMAVFTLPSYPYVFKVIKDSFAPPKEVDRATVKQKYQLVKQHDRVGRMADTMEYSDVAMPKERFSQELWDELCQVCASSIETDGDLVVIKHLYIERRMIPLNMYVQNANSSELHDVIRDYGASLKQMAAANIFPGDMLFKNFGVTQHGRIVFYDYDEICYMTECNFRRIPPPRYPEDEMAAEPWYSVAPNDVFPEEFATFLLVNSKIRKFFEEYHEELLYPEWWQEKQASIRSGVLEDVFPYPENIRFPRP